VENIGEASDPGSPKRIQIDMSHAYPDPTLAGLNREFTLYSDGEVRLSDRYQFTRKPRSVEEAFITVEPVTVRQDGMIAVVGRKSVSITAETSGRFRVAERSESIPQGRDGQLLWRVVFRPSNLQRGMTVGFVII